MAALRHVKSHSPNLPVDEYGGLHRSRSLAEFNFQPLPDEAKKIDIVLVPAIGADSARAWNLPDEYGQTIYHKIPSARVLPIYSYDQVESENLNFFAQRLLDHVREHRDQNAPDRPIHFAAHSTGGLVVKMALLIAHRDPVYHQISQSCSSVTFMGVPHRGSSVLSQQIFANSVKDQLALKSPMSEGLRRVLDPEENEKNLQQLDHDFAIRARRLHRIWTILETIETTLDVHFGTAMFNTRIVKQIRAFIVDSRSATLRVGNETVFDLESDHASLCRFGGRAQPNSEMLNKYRRALSALIDDIAFHKEDRLEKLLRSSTTVDVNEFLETNSGSRSSTFQILTARPTLETFFQEGPNECLAKRVQEDPWALAIPEQDKSINVPEITLTREDTQSTQNSEDRIEGTNTSPLNAPSPPTKSLVTFSDNSTSAFRWIHLPSNNPTWTLDVFDVIAGDDQKANPDERIFNEHVWHPRHNLSHYGIPHSRRMKPVCYWLSADAETNHTAIDPERNARMVLYLPYLHWDTLANLQLRSERIKMRREWTKASIPHEVFTIWSTEHQLLWRYLHGYGNLEVHIRRSLDQFGYPSLADTRARDQDQVLNKQNLRMGLHGTKRDVISKKTSAAEQQPKKAGVLHRAIELLKTNQEVKRSGKVLMVDQLWLYVLDEKTVVTCFTPKEKNDCDGETNSKTADLRTNIVHDVNGDPRFATPCRSPLELSALIVLHAVKVILGYVAHEELQVFAVFESYISQLAEAQSKSFKNFRISQERRYANQNSGGQAKQLTQAEQDQDTEDNIEDLRNLTELRDVDDELTTLRKLLDEQLDVVTSMRDQAAERGVPAPSAQTNTRGLIKDAEAEIKQYSAQVDRLKLACKSAHDGYVFLLDMRDKQANVYEARQSRQSAQLATRQNRSIVFFTIFTIIFLPLSFFTSLFGMNVSDWSNDQSDPTLGVVFIIMWPLSIAVICIALGLAYSKQIRKLTGRAYRAVGAALPDRLRRVTHKTYGGRHDIKSGLSMGVGPENRWWTGHLEDMVGMEVRGRRKSSAVDNHDSEEETSNGHGIKILTRGNTS